MKTIIIEDEKPAARRLERMLIAQGLEIETILYSVESSIKWFKSNSCPALLFSDIQLGDGLSFEIFESVNLFDSFIIFTTAFDQYTLKAFKLNSIDYLLKPIQKEELRVAIHKFSQINYKKEDFYPELLKNMFAKNFIYKERFLIKAGNLLKPVYAKDISCFFSENKITYLQISDRGYPLDITLDELEEELNPKNFFRISRQCIIHISYIKDILPYSNSRLQINVEYKKESFIVSRERVSVFKSWLGE